MKTMALWLVPAYMMMSASADAATLLSIDLSIANQITITAEDGLASASEDGSDFTGFYLDQFYSGPGSNLSYGLISGDLTTANNPTDNTPRLYRGNSADTGLNVWSFSSDNTVSFTAGTLAFTGSATWSLSPDSYTDMLAGSTSGSIFFAADTIDDLAGATVIGEWSVAPLAAVPVPASALLLGSALFGLGMYRRRRPMVAAAI